MSCPARSAQSQTQISLLLFTRLTSCCILHMKDKLQNMSRPNFLDIFQCSCLKIYIRSFFLLSPSRFMFRFYLCSGWFTNCHKSICGVLCTCTVSRNACKCSPTSWGRRTRIQTFCAPLPGSSSEFLSELEALWAVRCTILKLYWALGFNWDRSGYHAVARQLPGPEGGGIGEQTGESLTAPAPSVSVVMNSYHGLEGCSAGILTVFL